MSTRKKKRKGKTMVGLISRPPALPAVRCDGHAVGLWPSSSPSWPAAPLAHAAVDARPLCDPCRQENEMDCSWVTMIAGEVVATVGLCYEGQYVARIYAFHVDPQWQHTSAVTKLIDCVRNHCSARGFVKVLLDSRTAPRWLISCMQRRGFRFGGRRSIAGRDTCEFYLDFC
jgi:hypothetical protein